jgi:hypothetical protein
MIRKILYGFLVSLLLAGSGCDDFLTTSSSTDILDETVFSSASTLQMLLEGTYRKFYLVTDANSDFRGIYKGITGHQIIDLMRTGDVLCQERMGGEQLNAYKYLGEATSAAGDADLMWVNMYNVINSSNLILDNIDGAIGSESTRSHIKGQALAMRAYSYFQLIQYYQQTYIIAQNKPGLPLRLHSDDPTSLPRSAVKEVYDQITADLLAAKSLLSSFTRPASMGKHYIDAAVTSGMLARVYLVMQNWNAAREEAERVLASYGTLMSKDQWAAFYQCSRYDEVVWAVYQTSEQNFGNTGQYNMWYNYPLGEGANDRYYNYQNFFVNDKYVELFDPGDDRYLFWKRSDDATFAQNWVNAKMYDPGDGNGNSRGDYCLMRGSEMLLIKAECEANSGNPAAALATLNTLQSARNVATPAQTADREELLEAIYLERRKELLGEGVAGLLDLLRLQKPMIRRGDHFNFGMANLNTFSYNGETVQGFESNDYRMIYQVPDREIQLNEAIGAADQNPFSGR